MKMKLKMLAIAVAVVCAGLQLTSPTRTNPSFDEKQTLQATTDVPAEVSEIFTRSCNDCHSNQTKWLWYTHVAPVSWFTVKHVNDGRSELNFSEWGTYSKRMKETRLKAMCNLVENKKMPLESYLWAHSEAELSAEDAKKICDWSAEESKRYSNEK